MGCETGYFLEYVNGQSTGICRPCSSEDSCATCSDSSQKCKSCANGFKFEGIRCISNTHIDMRTVFDTDVATFIANINAVNIELTNKLGSPYQGTPDLHIINSVVTGSANVSSTLSVPEGQSAASTQTDLQNIMQAGNTLGGLTILSSESIALDPAPTET